MQAHPFATRAARRARTALAATAVALLAAACDNSPTEAEDEPEVDRIVLTVGTGAGVQTLTYNVNNGQVTGGPITLPANTPRTLSAQFLRADGTPDPLVTEVDFRLDLNVANPAVAVFTRTSNLGGSLQGIQSGQSTTFTIALVHIEENHEEYGPSQAVTVNVQ